MKAVFESFVDVKKVECQTFEARLYKIGKENHGWGGVDAMRKTSVKSVLSAYVRYIAKKQRDEMPAGEYAVEIKIMDWSVRAPAKVLGVYPVTIS